MIVTGTLTTMLSVPFANRRYLTMDDLMITMKKSKSTKRFDVFESERPDAHITSLYINKGANAPENITVIVGDKK